MNLIVNILIVLSPYLLCNQNQTAGHKSFRQDYSKIKIIYESLSEEVNENNFSSCRYTEEIILKATVNFDHQEPIIQNSFTSFLSRTLPFLIDVPPPDLT